MFAATPFVNVVEVAPRISDREIIGSLTELKAGQKELEARMDQRFEAIDQQLDKIWALMLVMIAGIFGLIGYIVWDRKTALRPVEQRIMALEAEFHRDLEIQHEDGSRFSLWNTIQVSRKPHMLK